MYVVAKACRYRNKQLKPGDPFDGTKSETKLYEALGWIAESPPAPERTYTYTSDLQQYLQQPVGNVSTKSLAPVLTDVVKPKRTYRRRDQVAE